MNPFSITAIKDAPPEVVPIMQAEGQPMWRVFVHRKTPDEVADLLTGGPQIGGLREGSDAEKAAKRNRIKRYVKKVFVGWENATRANIEALLRRANKRISGLEQYGPNDPVPFDVELAVELIQHAWMHDFDAPILRAVKYGAQKVEEELEGKGDGSESSA